MSAEWTNSGAHLSTVILTASSCASLVFGAGVDLTRSADRLAIDETWACRRTSGPSETLTAKVRSRRKFPAPVARATRTVCQLHTVSEYYCVANASNKEWLWLPAASS